MSPYIVEHMTKKTVNGVWVSSWALLGPKRVFIGHGKKMWAHRMAELMASGMEESKAREVIAVDDKSEYEAQNAPGKFKFLSGNHR